MILGLAITQMLGTAAALVRHAGRVRFSVTQSIWMFNVTLAAFGNWLSLWQLRDVPVWGPAQLLFAIGLVVAQFIACALVCPDLPETGEIDMVAFHERERGRYLTAYLALALVAIAGNFFFAGTADVSRWAQENWLNFPDVVAIFVALVARDRWLRGGGLAIDTVLTLIWLATSSVRMV